MNFTPVSTIPDVSFWQDINSTPNGIDFVKMATQSQGVIIRAGQRNWIDQDFTTNWNAAKLAGLKRGSYWFYDSRETPQKQADLWKVSIGSDLPEWGLWIDLEENYGGSFKGEIYWKQFAEVVRSHFPGVTIGIYTAMWWWSGQTVHQTDYWQSFPLWVATYVDNSEQVLLPPPWKNRGAILWQFTAKGDGPSYGAESLNIDLNYTSAAWFTLFSDAPTLPPEPPPTGGTMKGVVNAGYTLTVRDSANADTGKRLHAGDIVYGPVTNNRIYFERIYRLDGNIEQSGGNVATVDPANTSIKWMTLTNEAEPAPPAVTVTDINIKLGAGSVVTTKYSDGSEKVETA